MFRNVDLVVLGDALRRWLCMSRVYQGNNDVDNFLESLNRALELQKQLVTRLRGEGRGGRRASRVGRRAGGWGPFRGKATSQESVGGKGGRVAGHKQSSHELGGQGGGQNPS